jgi:ribonuclease HII
MRASFELEAVELQIHGGPVAGVDEAGRGPLAGPVVAAAVILDPANIPDGIADSKTLEPEVRRALYQLILSTSQVGVGVAGVDRIDADNILNASLWAMSVAVTELPSRPRLALIDGDKVPPRLKCASRAIVRGDAKCLSIAAASIVAKVTRDTIMIELARAYPGYGFERHKGYATPEHHAAIGRLGVTPHHRRSFKAVQLALGLVGLDEVEPGELQSRSPGAISGVNPGANTDANLA